MADRDWHIQSIFHFTVNATNFERSLEFYTTIGFKVLRDNRDVDVAATVADGLRHEPGQGPRRAARYRRRPRSHPARPARVARAGVRPAAGRRADRGARAAHHRAADAATCTPRTATCRRRASSSSPRSLSYRADRHRRTSCCCRDPDGLLVEFIEYAPGVLGSLVGTYAKDPDHRSPGRGRDVVIDRASNVEAATEMFEAVKNWGRWGADDERGALNLITPEQVAARRGWARRGSVVSCGRPLPGDRRPSTTRPRRST